jgi:hypothetical protein
LSIPLVQERVAKGIFQRQQFGDDVVAEETLWKTARWKRPQPVATVPSGKPDIVRGLKNQVYTKSILPSDLNVTVISK